MTTAERMVGARMGNHTSNVPALARILVRIFFSFKGFYLLSYSKGA
jgi:hypothetical protein